MNNSRLPSSIPALLYFHPPQYRLEESVQGNEFEKIFVKVEPSTSSAASPSEIPEEEEELKEPRTTTILNKSSSSRSSSSRHHRNKCDICFKLFKLQGRLAHHRLVILQISLLLFSSEMVSSNIGARFTEELISNARPKTAASNTRQGNQLVFIRNLPSTKMAAAVN